MVEMIIMIMLAVPCIAWREIQPLFGMRPVIATAKLRSRDTMSLTENRLLMLSRCSRFKMAALCLKNKELKAALMRMLLLRPRTIQDLPAEKRSNFLEAVVRKRGCGNREICLSGRGRIT